MRQPLSGLDGRRFDVVIVGGGISGASTAQHLTGAGYSVLLVEKGDFASAATSRSSRLLHSGLRYLAPAHSPWEFVRHPGRLATALKTVKRAMETRAQFVETTPERVRTMTIDYPIYRGDGVPEVVAGPRLEAGRLFRPGVRSGMIARRGDSVSRAPLSTRWHQA